MAGSPCTKTVTLLLVLAFQLLTVSEIYTGKCCAAVLCLPGLSHAKDCEEGMAYERHHGVMMESCHIPEKVQDVYKYCRELKTPSVFAYADEVKLCFNPDKTRYRRQYGVVTGGLPGR